MNDAMTHRGPDDSGVWHLNHVALAARRLSVMDVKHGHQPMANEDGSCAVAFNGEIYNAAEIRESLQKKGVVFKTTCDTEVVLRAWEEYGEGALDRFNGMFAIAVYHASEDCLLLARDRLGIKPLYYTEGDESFAFASELDALARSGLITGQLSRIALESYFEYLYVATPDSIYEGVYKVRPGEIVRYRKGKVETERYWSPKYAIDTSWTIDSAAERYRELLDDAVRLQRTSDVPLGAFLSGGMDSSAVVSALAEIQSSPVKTFSIGFEDSKANELKYAQAIADRFGCDHTEAILKPDAVGMVAELTRHFGEPFADSSAIPTWMVSKLAREHVTVALSGDGGDELFAGYSWLHANLRVEQYRKMPGWVRGGIDVLMKTPLRSPSMQKLRRFHNDADSSCLSSFQRRSQCFGSGTVDELLLPHVRRNDAERQLDRYWEHAERSWSYADPERMLYQDTVMYLPDDILTKVDRMSMAVSLEARVPLLDHRMVEFAATVPFELKYSGGVSKRLVKHAMKERLPDSVMRQRKQGFSIPIHRWFREDLKDYFHDVVMGQNSRSREFLDMGEVRRLMDAHQRRQENYGHHLWTILMFEQWLCYASELTELSISL